MRTLCTTALAVSLLACGGSRFGGPGALSGDTFEGEGVAVVRPADWTFVEPDASVAGDIVIVLQGPPGEATLAPVVEIARRKLTVAERRRKPAHILTALVAEIVQTFASFDNVTEPREVTLAGLPGARIDLAFTEVLADGTSASRRARFYGAVRGDSVWLVRCLGPEDDSAAAAFDSIVASLRFE